MFLIAIIFRLIPIKFEILKVPIVYNARIRAGENDNLLHLSSGTIPSCQSTWAEITTCLSPTHFLCFGTSRLNKYHEDRQLLFRHGYNPNRHIPLENSFFNTIFFFLFFLQVCLYYLRVC
jgi:hypothetical protein